MDGKIKCNVQLRSIEKILWNFHFNVYARHLSDWQQPNRAKWSRTDIVVVRLYRTFNSFKSFFIYLFIKPFLFICCNCENCTHNCRMFNKYAFNYRHWFFRNFQNKMLVQSKICCFGYSMMPLCNIMTPYLTLSPPRCRCSDTCIWASEWKRHPKSCDAEHRIYTKFNKNQHHIQFMAHYKIDQMDWSFVHQHLKALTPCYTTREIETWRECEWATVTVYRSKAEQQQKSQHITNEHVTFNKESLFYENFPPIKA